ncbi:MAG: chlorite dismutase family protein [Dehalococcoidia bacterium]
MIGRPAASDNPEQAPGRRQVVKFSFFKVDPSWRSFSPERREDGRQAFEAAVGAFSDRLQIRAYSVVGMRGDCDLLLWQIGERLEDIQALHSALLGTPLGAHLSLPHSYLAMTRRSQYVSPDEASERLHLHPADSKYFFVYPFVKTREWYQLPSDERQALMNEHIRLGRKYASVKLNTTYSFGLDDQEFVVSFETDEPADFLDLVMELREAKTSLYTLRDTPVFTCISMSLRDALDTLDGVTESAGTPGSADAWTSVASIDDLPDGGSKLVYAGGEQVALFRVGGQFFAVGNRCPHANGPLVEGRLDGCTITCPMHDSLFDLQTGKPLRGPTSRPLKTFDVRVEDGVIYVSSRAPVA